MKYLKKIFGGIDLTWKKLIIFAVVTAIYTAIMALLPFTYDTSFRDIATYLEWWILFGIIIIANSKSAKDSALKCFIFFLISQPLIYLFQVPFSDLGFKLFSFYKYWFIWTIFTIPMGYIGYYIKKQNIVSFIILLPMLIILAWSGLGYLASAIDNFPHHLLSFISCFAIIAIVVLGIFDKLKFRLLSFGAIFITIILYIFIKSDVFSKNFEEYVHLDEYNLVFDSKPYISSFVGYGQGNAEVSYYDDETIIIRLLGKNNAKYEFTLSDGNHSYSFNYSYDKDINKVILKQKDLEN